MINSKWNPKDNSNHAIGRKVEIRLKLLSHIPQPKILDCFAGTGEMFNRCYKKYSYTGLDKKQINDERNIITIDNTKFLRTAKLENYNFFDLDSYGSPWHQFFIIIKRREFLKNEIVGFAITDGLDIEMKLGELPKRMKPYVGIPPNMKIPCLSRHHDFIQKLFIKRLTDEKGLEIVKAYKTQNDKKTVDYIGLLLKKA